MSNNKSKSRKGKKFVLKSFTLPYHILQDLNYDFKTPSNLTTNHKISKQDVNYWLGTLLEEGLVRKPHRGIYEITYAGKNLIEGLERQNRKNMVRLENWRFRYPILHGMKNFILAAFSGKYQQLNNVRVYHGEESDHSYRIFAAKDNPSLEVTTPPRYGYNIWDMSYVARRENELVAGLVAENNGLKLGRGEQSMEPEWAIPSPMAEAILDWTSSSQIRTPLGTINRSKGRNADLETRDIRLAHEILMMPFTLKEISHNLEKLAGFVSYRSPMQVYSPSFL